MLTRAMIEEMRRRLWECRRDAALIRDVLDATTGTETMRSHEALFADDLTFTLSRLAQEMDELLDSDHEQAPGAARI